MGLKQNKGEFVTEYSFLKILFEKWQKIIKKNENHWFFNGLQDLHRKFKWGRKRNQNYSYDGDDFSHVVCIEIF